MLDDAGLDQPVADVLRGAGGGGDHSDGDVALAHDRVEVVERGDLHVADLLADPSRVAVEQGRDLEAARGEARVVGQRVTEVSDPDDDDRPVLGEADLAGDLVAQVVDVVPDPSGAVGAEVGEVLAQLRGVDAGGAREVLAAGGGDVAVGQGGERAQVDRKPRDGGFGDAALGPLVAELDRPCGYVLTSCDARPARPGESHLRSHLLLVARARWSGPVSDANAATVGVCERENKLPSDRLVSRPGGRRSVA